MTLEAIPKWAEYSGISSLLCIFGALCVPLSSVLSKPDSHSSHNTKLVNYGLSLSAGSMVTTALYKMLPVINHDNRYVVFFGVFFGIFFSLFLNYIVHAFASQSLIHCAHGEHDDEHEEHHHHHHSDDIVVHHNEYGATQACPPSSSDSAQIQPVHSDDGNVQRRTSLIDLLTKATPHKGDCYGISDCTPLLKAGTNPCITRGSLAGSRKSRPHHRASATSANAVDQIAETSADQNAETDAYVNANRSLGFNNNNPVQVPAHTTVSAPSHVHSSECKVSCMENTIGYDLENLSMYRKNYFSGNKNITLQDTSSSSSSTSAASAGSGLDPIASVPSEHSEHQNSLNSLTHTLSSIPFHHHHVETPFSKLLSIGMQTCLVLTLHKFPEGFIIFYTNKSKNDSKDIGFSIFISLAIHNFVEGFAMTLPFYSIFENKSLSILITAVLGGGSQPLGALIGYLIFKNKNLNDPNGDGSEPNMDLLLSITAGFLLVIALQMFQTGIGFSDGHHHHDDDDTKEVQENHSLGTTCLKWCCAGVLLILASSIFV